MANADEYESVLTALESGVELTPAQVKLGKTLAKESSPRGRRYRDLVRGDSSANWGDFGG